MVNTSLPWLARPALLGLAIGLVAAVALPWVGGPFAAAWGLALAVSLYLVGVVLAARRRLAEVTRYILRLREELRLCQDHIMEHGSSRSLAAWVDGANRRLRPPLGALLQETRALAADASTGEAARAAAARLGDHAAAVAGALGPIAGFSLPAPALAPFNLNTLMREAIDLCRHRAEEKRIRFEERYAVIPPVFGPAGRVRAALLNVVVNAVEAMPHEGGAIVVETAHAEDRVIVRVRDSGIGIRPEHLGKIFEPFFTTKPERTSAGLGLWEARETLDSIGARVTLHSVPHAGTEMTLTFPQAAPLSPGRAGPASVEELPRNTADVGDRRIA